MKTQVLKRHMFIYTQTEELISGDKCRKT